MRTLIANGTIVEWILHEGCDKTIWGKLEDICLSMKTDGRIHLPPVTENHIPVVLPPKARKVYNALKKDLVAGAELLGEAHTAANAAVLTTKLAQVSAGFLFVDDADLRDYSYTPIHDAKVKALAEVVEYTDSPVLVFYRFRPERAAILAELGDKAHTIDEPGVIDAWNRGEIPVLVAHPASAGHGLNLQYGGHTIVWTSLDWDLELWQQANKRLARQGQENPVVIHVLMADDAIDSVIRASLDDKDAVQGALLDHLESPI